MHIRSPILPFYVVVTWLVSLLTGLCLETAFAADGLETRPFLAIWRDSGGFNPKSEAPYLRIAIWNDGRVLFAKDSGKWNHELRQGRIDSARIAELKKAVKATGVFELKGNCYLVPDAPVDCLMVDMGEKQQMLYWDEVESPGYGINISPTPRHLKFKKCWREVNKLALETVPKQSEPYGKRFQMPTTPWRIKKPIQSE